MDDEFSDDIEQPIDQMSSRSSNKDIAMLHDSL